MPNLGTPAERFGAHTGPPGSMVMSTSGSAMRGLPTTHTTTANIATRNRPIVGGEVQPQLGPSLTATSSATSQVASSSPPAQSTLPGVRIGDSGIITIVMTATGISTASGSQNSQWESR